MITSAFRALADKISFPVDEDTATIAANLAQGELKCLIEQAMSQTQIDCSPSIPLSIHSQIITSQTR